jgi:hypothetical protein
MWGEMSAVKASMSGLVNGRAESDPVTLAFPDLLYDSARWAVNLLNFTMKPDGLVWPWARGNPEKSLNEIISNDSFGI